MGNHNIILEMMRAMRESAGYTQIDASKKFSVSDATISSWETGKNKVHPYDAIERYAHTFGKMPVGVFLVLTRAVAMYRDKKEEQVLKLVAGIRDLAEALENGHETYMSRDFGARETMRNTAREDLFKELRGIYLERGIAESATEAADSEK